MQSKHARKTKASKTLLPLFMVTQAACASTLAGSEANGACPRMPANELMRQPYVEFDTSAGSTSWRSLLNRGCVDVAVATLEAYRSVSRSRMTDEQAHELAFHIGQTLAFSGREQESISHFSATIGPSSSVEWRAYVEATLAFLRKDRTSLAGAAERYQGAKGADPMRLAVIRGFLACLDQPYKQAVHCAM